MIKTRYKRDKPDAASVTACTAPTKNHGQETRGEKNKDQRPQEGAWVNHVTMPD